jgi:hypothetical protein
MPKVAGLLLRVAGLLLEVAGLLLDIAELLALIHCAPSASYCLLRSMNFAASLSFAKLVIPLRKIPCNAMSILKEPKGQQFLSICVGVAGSAEPRLRLPSYFAAGHSKRQLSKNKIHTDAAQRGGTVESNPPATAAAKIDEPN